MTNANSNKILEEARDKLRFWAIRDGTIVLDVLKEHPQLAQETFFCGCVCNGKKGQTLSPLASLVAMQAPLDIIQQALDVYPDAALGRNYSPNAASKQQQQQDPCLPLHVAAATGGPRGYPIVQFLAQQYPQTVSMVDASGNLPLHHALQSPFEQASLATLQCLLAIYPEAVIQANHNGETPLQLAVENGYQDDVMDYLVAHLPKSYQSFVFGNCLTLNLARCQAMTRLLPHLTCLTCRPSQWTWDGLVHLLTTMTDSPSSRVTKLVLEWIPRSFFTSNHRMGQLLRDLLRPATTSSTSSSTLALSDLRLQVKNAWFDKNRNSDIMCLETLQGIFQSLPATTAGLNPFRFSLSLHSFQLYKESLEDFMVQARPVHLSLNCCTIFENTSLGNNGTAPENVPVTPSIMMGDSNHHQQRPASSSLERLELVQTRMSNTIFQAMLDSTNQQQMPHLKHLKLVFRRSEDMGNIGGLDLTDYVADMLPCLQSLTLEGLFVSPKLLAEYAKPVHKHHHHDTTTSTNSSSKMVIDTHCYMEYIQYGQVWRNLQYYTALNHFAKSLLSQEDATQSSFLQVLQALDEFEDIKEAEVKDQVRYGLLNECPGLWNNP